MSKRLELSEAVARYVHDGDVIYAAGFTHLIPFAAGHEIIRQGRKNLTLARATPDLLYDQMVAAGCASKVIFSYMGNPGVGSLRFVRSEIEAGNLEWEEYSHFGMISRLQAGATGLPFMPMNPTAAGDLEKANSLYRTVTDPYSGREVVVVPALKPDVAIIHVQRADEDGNAHIWGIIVDAVCHVPYCAHPSYTQGYYDRDNKLYLEWDEISKTAEGMKAYLDEWVFGVQDRSQYWEKLGPETHARLKIESKISLPVDYGRY
jgi:glutaconate CoA-transferase, subunit A